LASGPAVRYAKGVAASYVAANIAAA